MKSVLIISLLVIITCIDGADEEKNIRRYCRVDLKSCFPTQLDLALLDNNMTGSLVFPDYSNYTRYNYQHNKRTTTYPILHAVVRNSDDIRAAIKFARDHNLRVTVKSSGFDFWGRSSAHASFSINLMEMKGMWVTPSSTDRSEHGELKVETGVTWREMYQEVHNYDRIVIGGMGESPTTGGFTLGGGHSSLSPSIGLAVDNLLEVQVVLADGRISTCTENQTKHLYPDGTEQSEDNGKLFWALKGGGGGTFGVVVYYVFKLHQAPESLVKFTMLMPFYHKSEDWNVASDFFSRYYSWTTTAPSYWGGSVTSTNFNSVCETMGLRGNLTGTIFLYLIKLGPWDESTISEIQEFLDLNEELPTGFSSFTLTNESSFWDIAKDYDDLSDPTADRPYSMGSLIPADNHTTSLTNFLWQEYHNDDNIPLVCIFIRLGGKVAEFSLNSSSVHPGWRSAQTCATCVVRVGKDPLNNLNTFKEQARLKAKAIAFAADLRTFGNGEHISEGDSFNPNWKIDSWGKHYVDLLKLKIRYDPDNFFSCHHCVGSDYGSFRDAFASSASTVKAIIVHTLILSILLIITYSPLSLSKILGC